MMTPCMKIRHRQAGLTETILMDDLFWAVLRKYRCLCQHLRVRACVRACVRERYYFVAFAKTPAGSGG